VNRAGVLSPAAPNSAIRSGGYQLGSIARPIVPEGHKTSNVSGDTSAGNGQEDLHAKDVPPLCWVGVWASSSCAARR